MNRKLLALLFIFTSKSALSLSDPPIETRNSDFKGFYSYIRVLPKNKKWQELNMESIKPDFVDGASIMLYWNDIEPQKGVYNWDSLDQLIKTALIYKKKIAIGIEGGGSTPNWLYEPIDNNGMGVTKITFSPYDVNPPNGKCQVLVEPAMWEDAYIKSYISVINALSKHLRELVNPKNPSDNAYNSLKIVKLAGIVLQTEELRINAHPPEGKCTWADGTEGIEANAAALWASAGYRPSKILQAWSSIQDGIAQAFPDKILNVAIIPKGAFPPIDETGHVDEQANITPPSSDPMTLKLLNQSIAIYGRRLLVQWNALSQFQDQNTGNWVLPQEISYAANSGAQIGWQLNNLVNRALGPYGGTGCIYPPFTKSYCKTQSDFEQIFKVGMQNKGVFFEIHTANIIPSLRQLQSTELSQQMSVGIDDYTPAIRSAHELLWKK